MWSTMEAKSFYAMLELEFLCVPSSVRPQPGFWYREPKPRTNFGIGIGAETFFSETETFFFQIFTCHVLPFFGGI